MKEDPKRFCTKNGPEESRVMADRLGLAGSVQVVWTRCAKTACRCARGERHGPYFRRVWREMGVTRVRYIRLADVPTVAAAIATRRRIRPSGRETQRRLRGTRRLAELVEQAAALLREGDADGFKALMAGVEEADLLEPW